MRKRWKILGIAFALSGWAAAALIILLQGGWSVRLLLLAVGLAAIGVLVLMLRSRGERIQAQAVVISWSRLDKEVLQRELGDLRWFLAQAVSQTAVDDLIRRARRVYQLAEKSATELQVVVEARRIAYEDERERLKNREAHAHECSGHFSRIYSTSLCLGYSVPDPPEQMYTENSEEARLHARALSVADPTLSADAAHEAEPFGVPAPVSHTGGERASRASLEDGVLQVAVIIPSAEEEDAMR